MSKRSSRSTKCQAHPRSRGENAPRREPPSTRVGSSPLTRGKCDHAATPTRHHRLIPAHAGKICCDTRGSRHNWAHPRSRGENAIATGATLLNSGSSPLTRGKYGGIREGETRTRLIPAHAGKMLSRPLTRSSQRAHPRSRGENLVIGGHIIDRRGSSPLTRGKFHLGREAITGHGLIPAHAGKISRRPASQPRCGAHPRSRGENIGCLVGAIVAMGSSPLTRGKSARQAQQAVGSGLIPAHAGKIRAGRPSSRSPRAHPRSRGENLSGADADHDFAGSSPLTRGKFQRWRMCRVISGLIPAHAGKISKHLNPWRPAWAHPRSRGENLLFDNVGKDIPGSSPLTRGKLGSWSVARNGWGLIPAHAGKIMVCSFVVGAAGAHPRSRGENASSRSTVMPRSGSSPLTRGKFEVRLLGRRGLGLIPAHAGKMGDFGPGEAACRAHPRSRGENFRPLGRASRRAGSSPLTRGKSTRSPVRS